MCSGSGLDLVVGLNNYKGPFDVVTKNHKDQLCNILILRGHSCHIFHK